MYTKAQQRALFAKWEKILEKEGLGDIETHGYLRVYHDQRLKTHVHLQKGNSVNTEDVDLAREDTTFNPVKNEAKEAYYQLAGAFLNTHKFENARERKIWELHSQGMPVRQIAKAVRQPRNWSQINKKIVQLRKLMLKSSST